MIDNKNQNIITIALDAMGGDNAPDAVLRGADLICSSRKDIRFLIFGNDELISPSLKKFPNLKDSSEIIHSDEVVLNDDKPSLAIRKKRHSSMAMAVKSVRKGNAIAAISSGNTGALMAFSKIMLNTLSGIDRPAIGGIMPTNSGDIVMLDMGANVACDANNLFEFAVMGDAFARAILNKESPSIGLLNIGSEEMKGNESIKNAAIMLNGEPSLDFYGNIEGDDIGKGIVDVVVTDGFTGNIALKTAEGTAKMYTSFLKDALKSSLCSKIGALLAKPALSKIKDKLDPRKHNGAMLLGLNGIVIKSHGGTDDIGFENAIKVAIKLIEHDINKQIIEEMATSGSFLLADDDNDDSNDNS